MLRLSSSRATATRLMETAMSETPIRKTETSARQGKTGLNVRYVLVGGLILVIVAFALVYAFGR